MTELYRYAAFISYSSRDAAFARRLHRALESYGIPASIGKFNLTGVGKTNRIYPVFRDREELAAGNLGDAIEANLRASAALIVVCSPNAAASPWVEKEIEFFAGLGRANAIFAIVADTAPLYDEGGADATALAFPAAFRGDSLAGDKLEPLAADARKGKDGFRNAWLKIVAGMLGVAPGQLLDRDKKRRREQLLRATGAILLPVLLLATAWANWERLKPEFVRLTRYEPYVLQAAPSSGRSFLDCGMASDCPEMVVLPSGRFSMGSARYFPRELPIHQVVIRGFAASKYEITFAQWDACADGGGCRSQQRPQDNGWGRGRRPVIFVSWTDAQEYVQWLSRMTGHRYRLLSEAEWEYAARGVTSASAVDTHFSWGDASPICDPHAPNGAVYMCDSLETYPAGSFRPNRFGLFDMHGNVAEWTEDCWSDSYVNAPTDGTALVHAACDSRIARGGAWSDNHFPGSLRSAQRYPLVGTERRNDIGFRVAREL